MGVKGADRAVLGLVHVQVGDEPNRAAAVTLLVDQRELAAHLERWQGRQGDHLTPPRTSTVPVAASLHPGKRRPRARMSPWLPVAAGARRPPPRRGAPPIGRLRWPPPSAG